MAEKSLADGNLDAVAAAQLLEIHRTKAFRLPRAHTQSEIDDKTLKQCPQHLKQAVTCALATSLDVTP